MAEELDPKAMGARRFAGRVAVVGGAGQGIGRATARRLAAEGAAVVVADHVESTAQRVCQEIRDHGERAVTFVGDLREKEACEALMQRAVESFGRLDCLACIAGGNLWTKYYHKLSPDQVEASLTKNLSPTLWMTYYAVPIMIEQNSGSIVNVATHAVVNSGHVPYATAKGGVISLTLSLSKEVAAHGIRVNCVAPAHSRSDDPDDRLTPSLYGVDVQAPASTDSDDPEGGESPEQSEMRRRITVPMGRRGTMIEQAAAIAFLLSEDASYITGQILPVNGGATYPF
ncbi:MAG TPA: SDR family oxidoreductase [Dehalococcoidia bacterium]|nr:SDR family oxidoreductase [Dehalococcoidia bacterium]